MSRRIRDVVFYDGACGLCHAMVRFTLPRDHDARFAFAPLGGDTFRSLLPAPALRDSLPDSVVVKPHDDDAVLLRSDAVIHILRRLPRPWPALASALAVMPRPLRDAGYRVVASLRRRLTRKPKGACPIVAEHLRDRLLP